MTQYPPPGSDSAHALGMVLDHMSDLVAMLDTDGRRLYNSPAYKGLFGDRDLIGSDSFHDIHPEDRERVLAELMPGRAVRMLDRDSQGPTQE